MKTIKILDLDELGAIEFKEHQSFLDSIHGTKFFDNNYGVSIICKCEELEKANEEKIAIKGLYSTSHGSWENQTFELAVIKGNEESSYFIVNEFLEQEDVEYSNNGGMWGFKTIDEVKKIISSIKNLEKIISIPVTGEE